MSDPQFTLLAERRALRRQMRDRRRALSDSQRRRAAARLARHLRSQLALHRSRRVGLYLPSDGELDATLWARSGPTRQLFLPRLDRLHAGHMHFARWQPDQALVANRYGIDEPAPDQPTALLWSLDLLLIPLVAFDGHGQRLGMGGGFYDRALARLLRQPRRPRLVGVGYRFQQVPELPTAAWDQPLDAVVTD